jgi:hypothetical protein
MCLVIYSEITFIFFRKYLSIGIFVLCGFKVLGFYSVSLFLTANYYDLGSKKEFINERLLM